MRRQATHHGAGRGAERVPDVAAALEDRNGGAWLGRVVGGIDGLPLGVGGVGFGLIGPFVFGPRDVMLEALLQLLVGLDGFQLPRSASA